MKSRLLKPLRKIFTMLLVFLTVIACKKDVVPTQPAPEPEPEVVIPGKTVGFGVELVPAEEYEKLPLIAEPVMANGRTMKDPTLTPTYDLTAKMPPVASQGNQNSCTAWATAFAARSYLHSRLTGASYVGSDGNRDNARVFSPAFVYNQINGGNDKGSFTYNALDLMKNTGVCSWQDMPYKDTDFLTKPTNEQTQKAGNFKIKDWGRINISESVFKKFIYYDYPVIISAYLDNSFLELTHKDPQNEFVWKENTGAKSAHAMVVVGYDDSRKAFKVQNSWGKNWANRGYIWLSYELVEEVIREAYIMIVDDKSIVAPPKVETVGANLEEDGEVVFSARVTDRGDAPILGVGFCIASTRSLPEVKSSVRIEGISMVPYNFTYSQRLAGDTLWYRAYAETVSGTVYGDTAHVVLKNTSNPVGSLAQNTLFFNDGRQAFSVDVDNGTVLWTSPKDGSSNDKGSVYANGMYVFGEHRLVGVDAVTGKTKWMYSDPRYHTSFYSQPVAIGGTVFMIGEYRLTAIDVQSGLKLWSLDAAEFANDANTSFHGGLSVTKDNKLFFVTWGRNSKYTGYIVSDPRNGKSITEFDNQGESYSGNPFWDDNQLVMATGARDLKSFALKPAPKEMWRSREFLSSSVISNNVVVGHDVAGKALKGLDKATGTRLWQYTPAVGEIYTRAWSVSGKYAAMTVMERTSAFGGNRFIHVIDITNGKLVWEKKLATTVAESVLAAGNKVVTWDGEAVAFDIATGNQLWKTNVNTSKLIFPRDMVVVQKNGTSYYMVESGMK
ncbi:outer membrane protein assembly factor BamB family protein [Dyadobacter fermentans]|nr:PQQ-binding-like beta-propeller repeat protein [Dyadobacter fermentans]